jgi:hypothetical protein
MITTDTDRKAAAKQLLADLKTAYDRLAQREQEAVKIELLIGSRAYTTADKSSRTGFWGR